MLQQRIQVHRIGPGDSASVSFSRCDVSILVQNSVDYKDCGFTWFLPVCLFKLRYSTVYQSATAPFNIRSKSLFTSAFSFDVTSVPSSEHCCEI